jgi:uncharacterized protein YegP (UPF0339 family)
MIQKVADKAEIFQSKKDGLWYVRTISADNGRIILSSEGYEDREWALVIAEDTGLPVSEVVDG